MVRKKSNNLRVSNGRKSKGNSKNVQTPDASCEKEKEKNNNSKENIVGSNNNNDGGRPKKEVDVGLDISSSCIGVCILEHKKDVLVEIFKIKLTSTKFEDLIDKAVEVKKHFSRLSKYSIKNVYVEDIALKFTSGKSSAHTIVTLAKMNALTCYEMYSQYNIKPEFVNVRTCRKKLGISINTKDKTKSTKEKVFDIVRVMKKDFPWETHLAKTGKYKDQLVYDKTNQDMADAYIVCASGQLIK